MLRKKFACLLISWEMDALIVDGIYGKIGGEGKGVILAALGVDSKGQVHILDWGLARSESHQFWIKLLRRLKKGGLNDVQLVGGDVSLGLPPATDEVYNRAKFQICLWHFYRDMMKE